MTLIAWAASCAAQAILWWRLYPSAWRSFLGVDLACSAIRAAAALGDWYAVAWAATEAPRLIAYVAACLDQRVPDGWRGAGCLLGLATTTWAAWLTPHWSWHAALMAARAGVAIGAGVITAVSDAPPAGLQGYAGLLAARSVLALTAQDAVSSRALSAGHLGALAVLFLRESCADL